MGDEIKKAREVILSVEVEGENFVKIKVSEVEDNREWLKRSVVGIAFGLVILDVIET